MAHKFLFETRKLLKCMSSIKIVDTAQIDSYESMDDGRRENHNVGKHHHWRNETLSCVGTHMFPVGEQGDCQCEQKEHHIEVHSLLDVGVVPKGLLLPEVDAHRHQSEN